MSEPESPEIERVIEKLDAALRHEESAPVFELTEEMLLPERSIGEEEMRRFAERLSERLAQRLPALIEELSKQLIAERDG